jgi:peptide/nickel transport system substrate-binding protein
MFKRSRWSRRLVVMLGAASILAACGTTGSSSGGGGSARPANTVFLGVWQEPSSFLAAGITNSLTFSYLIDAVSQEGLLWYRSTDDTAHAQSLADYWAPSLATEVPTTTNGDVKTSGCPAPGAAMCITWKLRSGVKWHDGSSFSSHDVCDTYQFYFLKYGAANNPTPILTTSGWDQVIDCKEDSPTQATVDFKSQFGPYLTLGSGVYGILPASILDKDFAANGGKGADVSKTKVNVDLTSGSGNSNAFKGEEVLDKFVDGTGPFVFSSYTKGQEIDFVANKNYWNKDHMPKLDKVVFKIEAALTNEVQGIQSGDIDGGYDYRLYNLKTLTDAAANGKIRVQTIPDSGAEKIDLNLCGASDAQKRLCGDTAYTNVYTSNPTVRKAMLMALDRKTIIHDQAQDKTVVPADSWMYLGVEYIHDPSIPTTPYDPQGAGKLLDNAGFKMDAKNCTINDTVYRSDPNGNCMSVNLGTTNNNPSRVATESEVEKYLAAIGIRVFEPFVPNKPAGDFFDSFQNRGPLYTHQFDMAMYTNTVSAPAEPDAYWAGYHADCGGTCPDSNQIPSSANKGQGQNDTGEDNPKLDAALDSARSTIDLAQRTSFYKQAEAQLAQDLPELPLFQQVTVDAYSANVQGVLPNDTVWDFNIVDWSCTNNQCNQS